VQEVEQPVKSPSAAANSTFLGAQHCFSYVEFHITEGAGPLSSPPPRESRTAPYKTHPHVLAPPCNGALAPSDNRRKNSGIISACRREIARSNQKRGHRRVNTTGTNRRMPAEWNAPTDDECYLLNYNGCATTRGISRSNCASKSASRKVPAEMPATQV